MSVATQPNPQDPKLCIGPAGWDYPDWQGVVYPRGLKGTDRLTFLATLFRHGGDQRHLLPAPQSRLRPPLAGRGE